MAQRHGGVERPIAADIGLEEVCGTSHRQMVPRQRDVSVLGGEMERRRSAALPPDAEGEGLQVAGGVADLVSEVHRPPRVLHAEQNPCRGLPPRQ